MWRYSDTASYIQFEDVLLKVQYSVAALTLAYCDVVTVHRSLVTSLKCVKNIRDSRGNVLSYMTVSVIVRKCSPVSAIQSTTVL